MKKKSLVCKVGFYEINKLTSGLSVSYEADSGKLIFVERFKKYMVNQHLNKQSNMLS
jgi:hypothetical protein